MYLWLFNQFSSYYYFFTVTPFFYAVPMKSTPRKGQIKRKQKTSLLKVANIKKRRTNKKMTITYGYDHKDALKTKAEFPETVLRPVDQLTKTRAAKEKLINKQHKEALQQLDMISLDQSHGFISYCDCLLCRNNYEWQNQAKILNKRKISQQQRTKNKASQINLDIEQANRYTAENFKVFLKTQRVEARVVSDRNFYQQNVDFNPNHVSNQQVNDYTTQPNWSDVNENQNNVQNLNKIDFHNRYVSCYDQNKFYEVYDRISTLQQDSCSMTTSVETIGSDTNNLMTSQHFDQSFMTSQQFQMSNNVNYCNYVY